MPLSQLHTLQILQLIRAQGSTSRADLADKTGASPFLVSKISDKLLAAGFISEAGQGDSTGGRRPTLLSLRPDFGRLIGVHLGTVNVRIAMTDFSGNLIEYTKDASHSNQGPEVAMRHLIDLIDQMLKKSGVSYAELNGIGIGVSGVLDRNTGITLFWPKLPQWVNVPVRKILEEQYRTLVELEDTSRTQAFAEYRLGGVDSAKCFIYIAIGAGIGAALFLNGQLYSGAGGFAGEFGHITISETGPLCSCGNRGCLETLVSASALIQKARHGLFAGLSNTLMQMSQGDAKRLSVEMLAQAAQEGDRFALRLLSEAGTHLGRGIVGLINLLNPELIVIGAGVASAVGELILPEIERVVRSRAMVQGVNQVQIRMSRLQEKDWALGATLLVAEKALAQSFLKWMEPKT
ncbi:MAG: ROK family transcriptional regulator [Acidobacteriaceae bacterium]